VRVGNYHVIRENTFANINQGPYKISRNINWRVFRSWFPRW